MKKKLPWLKYDMKKRVFAKVQGKEKSFKKRVTQNLARLKRPYRACTTVKRIQV